MGKDQVMSDDGFRGGAIQSVVGGRLHQVQATGGMQGANRTFNIIEARGGPAGGNRAGNDQAGKATVTLCCDPVQ